MDTQGFQVGDVVTLKSGGPRMTIVEIAKYLTGGDKLQAKCQWFAGDRADEIKENVFNFEALEK